MTRAWTLGALLVLGLACGGLPIGGEAELPQELPPESPFTWGLLMSWLALGIGGGSAVLGIWIDRDRSRPALFAFSLSGLILAAMTVGALQGYLDEEGAIETRANLERMLDMVEDLAESGGNAELAALVEREGAARRPKGKRKARVEAAEVAPAAVVAPAEGTEVAPAEGTPPPDPAEGSPPADGAAPATDGAAPEGNELGAGDGEGGGE